MLPIWDVPMEHMISIKISDRDVSSVTQMGGMFRYADDFNQDITTKKVFINGNQHTAWDVSNVTNMCMMFMGLKHLIKILVHGMSVVLQVWDVCLVMQLISIMRSCNIGSWNVSRVIDMEEMFNRASTFNQDIGKWPIKKIVIPITCLTMVLLLKKLSKIIQ